MGRKNEISMKNLIPNKGRRKKLTELEREAREQTRAEVAGLWQLYKHETISSLQKITKDPQTPAVNVWFISTIIGGIKKQDLTEYNRMAERILGKPREEIVKFISELDFSNLSVEQLKRIQNGEDPLQVITEKIPNTSAES